MGMGKGTGKGDREVDVMFGTSTFMLPCVSFVRFPMSSTSLSNHSVCGISGGRESMSITLGMDKESRERWRGWIASPEDVCARETDTDGGCLAPAWLGMAWLGLAGVVEGACASVVGNGS